MNFAIITFKAGSDVRQELIVHLRLDAFDLVRFSQPLVRGSCPQPGDVVRGARNLVECNIPRQTWVDVHPQESDRVF